MGRRWLRSPRRIGARSRSSSGEAHDRVRRGQQPLLLSRRTLAALTRRLHIQGVRQQTAAAGCRSGVRSGEGPGESARPGCARRATDSPSRPGCDQRPDRQATHTFRCGDQPDRSRRPARTDARDEPRLGQRCARLKPTVPVSGPRRRRPQEHLPRSRPRRETRYSTGLADAPATVFEPLWEDTVSAEDDRNAGFLTLLPAPLPPFDGRSPECLGVRNPVTRSHHLRRKCLALIRAKGPVDHSAVASYRHDRQ